MPTVLRDLASGQVHRLEDFTLIGRGDGATLRLSDAGVSRQHAAIRRENLDYWIVDLGSANGTFVNDNSLTAARVLKHGDRIRLGNLVLIFHQSEAAAAKYSDEQARTTISIPSPTSIVSEALTLFVADLKGFTRLSEQLPADQVAELLREWYADCQIILRRQGGTIDKFIGDCVFAYWHGIDAETRRRALRAAQELRESEIDRVSPARVQSGGVVLDCRIGIHVGLVAVGPMGKGISTALGDAVNTAFRIEGLTRLVGEPVLVSAAFVEDLQHVGLRFRSCGLHQLKGRAEPIEVFAPQ